MDNKTEIESLYARCIKLIYIRPRTEKEIKSYLLKLSCDQTLIDLIIDKLKKGDYLDDRKFISWWIGQREYFRPRGKLLLKSELIQKGVDREILEGFFNETNLDEVELALKALSVKKLHFDRIEVQKRFKVAVNYLLRRGFSYDIAKKAFEQYYQMS
ncbi:hypothetical protein A3C23_04150 [Candidatus Roizmanbacteria bacterium RIFCSPHIGHO2_02_FULL_37_13b]|uniref:Regulatory protein RecX n=1 Tax=Candidatus Roizmanbacteria bacterium RIFCSPLOWO2_02_FULL_36_11 TaxID=1802071 RepID=A0A1F7JH56_9BACT|nr:MAG: hypothetical protein A3C23_04150 [Candidatus Roizmanbacteria bacterium RIFCSPHIGHO2_02_FULL_37_13b]OGK54906.1 MAG: hypothetical protein A3H78_00295 [Candidatus Roizmanbacteria bacterium RIFCSPLOWO2_02_FULL_36_11]